MISDTPQPLPDGFTLDALTLLHPLRVDAAGITYLAREELLGREVRLREHQPQASREGFLDAARRLARLEHPNLLRVLAVFEARGTLWCVLSPAGGLPLDAYRARYGAPPEASLRALLRALLRGLGQMHAQGLGLGDIRPADILMSEAGQPLFTETCLSGQGGDAPADIAALGAVMRSLLAPEAPGDTRPLSTCAELAGLYSQGLLRGIDKALAAAPADRWSSAAEWEQAVAALPPLRAGSRRSAPRWLLPGLGCAALLGLGALAWLGLWPDWQPAPVSPAAPPAAEPPAPPEPRVESLAELPLAAPVERMCLSPDGSLLACVDTDYTLRLYAVEGFRQLGATVQHGDKVVDMAFSPDGRVLASFSQDATVRLLDARTGALIGKVLKIPECYGFGALEMCFSPDGRRLALLDNQGLSLVDTESATFIGKRHETASPPSGLAFSADGSRLLPWGLPLSQWEPADPKDAWRTPRLRYAPELCLSRDGSRAATFESGKSVSLCDTETFKPTGVEIWHKDYVDGMCFSPDAATLATCAGNDVFLWSVDTQQQLGATMKHAGDYGKLRAAFNARGDRLVSGYEDYEQDLRLWDARTGAPVALLAERGRFVEVAFSPGGEMLAVASKGALRFHGAETGVELGGALPLAGRVHAFCFSPDGRQVLTADDKGIRLWPVPQQQELPHLSP